jgi:hypothetical protein
MSANVRQERRGYGAGAKDTNDKYSSADERLPSHVTPPENIRSTFSLFDLSSSHFPDLHALSALQLTPAFYQLPLLGAAGLRRP